MGLSIDGLASDLDTTAIIKALMDVQSIPRTLLSSKIADRGVIIGQLQSLNSAVHDLATSTQQLAMPGALSPLAVRSSSTAVTASVRPTAAPGATEIVVDRLSARHTVVTPAYTAWPAGASVLTLENAAGGRIEITPASDSIEDVAHAITAAGAGISATVVSAGQDALGAPLRRLQLTADESGVAGAFRVYLGSIAEVEAATAHDIAAEPGGAIVTAGADAAVRLWAGTAAEQVMTSADDIFRDLLTGVDVTVTQTSAAPVTIIVERDAAARTKTVNDMVSQIAAVLTRIAKGSTATVAAPGETTTLGVFSGDSTVRALRGALEQAVQYPVDGLSPSRIGVSIDRYGALSFDAEKFAAASVEDPAAVDALVSGIAARVQQTAATYSDKHEGLLTARVTGQQDEVRSLGEQIDRWDVRLAQRKATLERTYARLETMLAQLQAQSSYLSSQLASLPGASESQR